MCSRRSFRALVAACGLVLAIPAVAAGPAPSTVSHDYVARIDGVPISASGTDGRVWSVWSYRSPGEFDVAVAVRDAAGTWSPTAFLGKRDGIDQLEPTIAIDDQGNVYVAYATRAPQRVWIAVLPAGAASFTPPSLVSSSDAASLPALRVVYDRVIVAYRIPRGLRIVEVPVYIAPFEAEGIQDGPDGVDPLGNNGGTDLPTGSDNDAPPSEDGD